MIISYGRKCLSIYLTFWRYLQLVIYSLIYSLRMLDNQGKDILHLEYLLSYVILVKFANICKNDLWKNVTITPKNHAHRLP